MAVVQEEVAGALRRYAELFHAPHGGRHHVGSPLGAWLLLALVGPASVGSTRAQLTDALGTDIDTASRLAGELLAAPHPVVSSAAAVWLARGQTAEPLQHWVDGLPPAVETGAVPSQQAADAWAAARTRGLIERFPLPITPDTLLVLASALAAKLTWRRPYEIVPADRLRGGPWTDRLTTVLAVPEQGDFRQFIADTELVGPVGVHVAADPDRHLLVLSVIAAAGVAPREVLAAAHRLAGAVAGGRPPARSLFDLPLGEGPAWTITERPVTGGALGGPLERCTAVLPAWSARTEHDLTEMVGFPDAARTLAALLGVPSYRYAARQSAMASYTREGFEAAAVTAIGVRASATLGGRAVRRDAELRFAHPYAVVAVAVDERRAPADAGNPGRPWHGLPVFSAWVAAPENATRRGPA